MGFIAFCVFVIALCCLKLVYDVIRSNSIKREIKNINSWLSNYSVQIQVHKEGIFNCTIKGTRRGDVTYHNGASLFSYLKEQKEKSKRSPLLTKDRITVLFSSMSEKELKDLDSKEYWGE